MDPRREPFDYDPRGRDPDFDPRNDPRDPRYPPRYSTEDDPRFDERGRGDRDGRYAPPPAAPGPVRRSRFPLIAIVGALAALLLVAFLAYRMTRAGPGEDRLDENAVAATKGSAGTAEERCGSQQTYDLVKREIFRRAAQVRGSDTGAFDRLAAYATVRVGDPLLKRQDDQLGTIVCSGDLALDLPPGVAVVGGRRTLQSQVDYALQPAADGSGDVVTLSGADPIIVPLATLARTGMQPGLPAAGSEPASPEPLGVPGEAPIAPAQPAPAAPQPAPPSPAPVPEPAPAPRETASTRPSFNCANARTRGEIAVCRNGQLATLDRRMSSQYFGAVRSATPEQRALLQRTRNSFLAFRDRCRTDACVAGAYNDRIREISDIMNDRWNGR